MFHKNIKNVDSTLVHKYTFYIIVNRYTVLRGNYTGNLYNLCTPKNIGLVAPMCIVYILIL